MGVTSSMQPKKAGARILFLGVFFEFRKPGIGTVVPDTAVRRERGSVGVAGTVPLCIVLLIS